MHKELVKLGVRYEDWNINNHLTAPNSPPGLPGLPSLWRGRVYSMRIVDFEMAERDNYAFLTETVEEGLARAIDVPYEVLIPSQLDSMSAGFRYDHSLDTRFAYRLTGRQKYSHVAGIAQLPWAC